MQTKTNTQIGAKSDKEVFRSPVEYLSILKATQNQASHLFA